MPPRQPDLRGQVSLAALRKHASNHPVVVASSSSSLNAKNLTRHHDSPSPTQQREKLNKTNIRSLSPPTTTTNLRTALSVNSELKMKEQLPHIVENVTMGTTGSVLVSNTSSKNTVLTSPSTATRLERSKYGYDDLLTKDNQSWRPSTRAVHGDSKRPLSMLNVGTLAGNHVKTKIVAETRSAEAKRMGGGLSAVLPGKNQSEKIAMKRTIAEDCSGERQHKKRLLYCLADRSTKSGDRVLHKNVDKHALASMMGLKPHVRRTIDDPEERTYGCKNCRTMLAKHDDIISRNFRGQHGKAYLFDTVQNITKHEAQERNMTTGRHILRDVSCRKCKEIVGWAYDKAYEASEKYKEGKTILEAELLCLLNTPPSKAAEPIVKDMLLANGKIRNKQTEDRESSLADRAQHNAIGSNASAEHTLSGDFGTAQTDQAEVDDSEGTAELLPPPPDRLAKIGSKIIKYIDGLKHLDDQQILLLLEAARSKDPA